LAKEDILKIQRTYFQVKSNYRLNASKYANFRVANSGIDANGIYQSFIGKDLIRNIDPHRDNEERKLQT